MRYLYTPHSVKFGTITNFQKGKKAHIIALLFVKWAPNPKHGLGE